MMSRRFCILSLLAAVIISSPLSCHGFSLRRFKQKGPMVQHIPVTSTHQHSLQQQQMTASSAATSTASLPTNGIVSPSNTATTLNPVQSFLTKIGMLTFIVGMCISLPLALLFPYFMEKIGVYDRIQKEKKALRAGHVCARTLSTLIPFMKVEVEGTAPEPEPSVWVCNHSSMLDVFVLLANDHRLRGPNRRPIKIVYWKQLEDNPITKLLFTECGFIPVQMADNGHGTSNDYDRSSFRTLLKDTKRAFEEGFDVGILPEGQLNPTPQDGLLPVFSGAYTLAKMSRRPIHFMAHYNIFQLWHPTQGMNPTGRNVKVRMYPEARYFESSDEFVATFEKVVGEYGTHGRDLPDAELQAWMDGSAWQAEKKKQELLEEQEAQMEREQAQAEVEEVGTESTAASSSS